MQQMIEVLPYVKILMTGGMAAQLASLAFLRNQPKLGLVLAMIGGIIFIPLGFIFIVGYLYDYNRVVYRSLKTVPKLAQLPFEVLLKFNKQRQISMAVLYRNSRRGCWCSGWISAALWSRWRLFWWITHGVSVLSDAGDCR